MLRVQRRFFSGGGTSVNGLLKLTGPEAYHGHTSSVLSGRYLRSGGSVEYNGRRGFGQSCALCGKFWESNPRGEYKDRKMRKDFEKVEREKLWGFKDGFKDLRDEVGKWAMEWKTRLGDDTHLYVTPGDKTNVWTFEDKTKLQNWSTIFDAQHNEGFSKCELTISPTGKGLFHGFVNTTPPKDGRVKYAGYCVMKSDRPVKSFKRKTYLEWSQYTHLIMRVRGDGRTYMLNISTAGYYDITWNDAYHYVLYTRGGPYWQYVKVGEEGELSGRRHRRPSTSGRTCFRGRQRARNHNLPQQKTMPTCYFS